MAGRHHPTRIVNGSIYIDMAHLGTGQQLLLSLPDERLGDDALVTEAGVAAGVVATFAERSEVSDDDVTALAELVAAGGGLRLLPRLVRYIEERRGSEGRFTGAIERHPSPSPSSGGPTTRSPSPRWPPGSTRPGRTPG